MSSTVQTMTARLVRLAWVVTHPGRAHRERELAAFAGLGWSAWVFLGSFKHYGDNTLPPAHGTRRDTPPSTSDRLLTCSAAASLR